MWACLTLWWQDPDLWRYHLFMKGTLKERRRQREIIKMHCKCLLIVMAVFFIQNIHGQLSPIPEPGFGHHVLHVGPITTLGGEIATSGTLPVSGPLDVAGYVPVDGSVKYAGDVRATGVASVYCSCGNLF